MRVDIQLSDGEITICLSGTTTKERVLSFIDKHWRGLADIELSDGETDHRYRADGMLSTKERALAFVNRYWSENAL